MENNTTTYHDGLEVRSSINHWRERPSRTKVYVEYDLGHDPEPTGPRCTDLDCGSPTCSYVRRDGHPERAEVDHKLWKTWRRKALRDQRERITPALADHFGVDPHQLKLRFSVKAGCSCGCSPGWFVDDSGTYNWSVYVKTAKLIGPGEVLASNLASIAREVAHLVRV